LSAREPALEPKVRGEWRADWGHGPLSYDSVFPSLRIFNQSHRNNRMMTRLTEFPLSHYWAIVKMNCRLAAGALTRRNALGSLDALDDRLDFLVGQNEAIATQISALEEMLGSAPGMLEQARRRGLQLVPAPAPGGAASEHAGRLSRHQERALRRHRYRHMFFFLFLFACFCALMLWLSFQLMLYSLL